MKSLQIVSLIILVNTFISVFYFIVGLFKKSTEMKINAFIMLFCPPVGPIYYLGQFIVYRISGAGKDMQLADIGFSKERHDRILSPNVESETQVVPLEEVLLVSDNFERRSRLLLELKKEHLVNFSVIAKALDNDDPETSHYAASAITSAKADYESDIRELDSQYSHNNNDLDLVRYYAYYVYSYLKSGILSPMEERKYSFFFVNILTSVENPKEFLNEEDLSNIVNEAINLKDFTIAERWAKFSYKLIESESTYLNLLKVYYYSNRSKEFLETLDNMKKSDVTLSYVGLYLVRFFMQKS